MPNARYSLLAGLILVTVPTMASAGLSTDPGQVVLERMYDDQGRLVREVGFEAADPVLGFAREYLHVGSAAAQPGGGGGGTGCASTAYKTAGWRWTQPFSTYASSYASIVGQSLGTWDQATGAAISGGATSGSKGKAGTQDFVNQIDWVNLGASTTIAVTTTWYYRTTGEAVESDGQYNTYYAWSTSGASNAMDVQNIVTHEVGHTFGLNHPTSTSSNACLTMYAYADYGETQKRTLGDGDVLGIRAIYGN